MQMTTQKEKPKRSGEGCDSTVGLCPGEKDKKIKKVSAQQEETAQRMAAELNSSARVRAELALGEALNRGATVQACCKSAGRMMDKDEQ